MTVPRRFPPPWDIEEHNRSCFIVRDNNWEALAFAGNDESLDRPGA